MTYCDIRLDEMVDLHSIDYYHDRYGLIYFVHQHNGYFGVFKYNPKKKTPYLINSQHLPVTSTEGECIENLKTYAKKHSFRFTPARQLT